MGLGGVTGTAPPQAAPGHRCVVLGGTFDRLHNGHRLLLRRAAEVASEMVLVGVTDGDMNKNKELGEMIEPLEARCAAVRAFLESVRPGLQVVVEAIYDPFGPAATLEEADCIVVSEETRRGGDAVNSKRSENGLRPLAVEVVALVGGEGEGGVEVENKVSSSTLRRQEHAKVAGALS